MTETVTISVTPALTLRHTRDTRFKTARLTLVLALPADGETSPLTTLLCGIFSRGSEHYPRLALLNRRLDELYGTTLAVRNYLHGDSHVVCYTAEMPEQVFLPPADADMDILGGVTELLADMLLRPLTDGDGTLCARHVEREKQTLCDGIRAQRNDPRAYAGNRLREIMCKGEPYGISIDGSVEQVMAVTPEQVTAHHKALLSRVRLEVFYTGRASCETVAAALTSAFAGWKPTPVCMIPAAPHIPPAVPVSVTEDMEVSQGKLCMAWACGENFTTLKDAPDDRAAYAVCNELFGVMQSSLLFRHVREELGLCYYCDSALDMTKGILWVSCGIRPEKRAEAEAAITEQLARIQRGEITPDETERAKLSLQNVYRQMEDSQSAREIFSLHRLLNATTDTPGEELDRIMRVTPADLSRVASRFRPDTVFFLNGTAEEGEEDYDE